VIADGTFEYEVVDKGRELALTLLRATGWLSRRQLPLRPDPAGPAVAVDGAQVQGVRRWRYGLLLHAGDWESADLMATAGEFLDRFEAVTGSATPGSATGAARPSEAQVLRVDGPEVSAVGRDREGLFVRMFNPGPRPTSATVGGADVHETVVSLRGGEIVTVRPPPRPGRE
jgi:alpha-mannosidase